MLPENVAKVDPLIQSFGLSKRSQYSTHLYGGMILDLVFDILNFNTVSSLRSPYSDHFVCIFVIIYIYIYIYIYYIITLLHNWYRWLLHLDWMCFWAVIITLFLFFGYNFVFFFLSVFLFCFYAFWFSFWMLRFFWVFGCFKHFFRIKLRINQIKLCEIEDKWKWTIRFPYPQWTHILFFSIGLTCCYSS